MDLKELLKNNMVVEIDYYGESRFGIVKASFGRIETSYGFHKLSYYNEGLEDKNEGDRIVKIYENVDGELKCIWDREKDFTDWLKVKVDTPIIVRNEGSYWVKRHFCKYEDGNVYTWEDGKTSFTTDFTTYWEEAKLYVEGDK